ncbi:MAG: tRNA glutamyl-Q(34) synthetase GluQRS [Clostridiales bacterium]|nr:tRNA glutamyl-Q(34) synthetase GluQRS [Clostridiales bacterium]
MSTAIGRFAPSPSGRMHLGNAFSCLLAWLSVRSVGGRMLLRIEDLDPERCRPDYARQVEDDLRWLGLDWDEGGVDGSTVCCQSRRRAIYARYLDILADRGLLYPCFCTRGELHAASAPHASDGTPLYPGTCRNLSPAERARRAALRRPALRVCVPDREISFTDRLQGPCRENLARDCGDFILCRSDGVHAYQLAVVVDDGLMGVTQVVRGRDLLSSTPRQLWLQEVLGFSHPTYAHVPLLLSADGRRLSKRDRDLDLGSVRAAGQTPEAVVGRLAFWAGLIDRPESVSARELVDLFDWDRVRREDVRLGQNPALFEAP